MFPVDSSLLSRNKALLSNSSKVKITLSFKLDD